jgi:hypothetical protein
MHEFLAAAMFASRQVGQTVTNNEEDFHENNQSVGSRLFLGMRFVECGSVPADDCNGRCIGVNQSADSLDHSANSDKGERMMMSKLFYGLLFISSIGATFVGGVAQARETNITGLYAAVPIDPVVINKEDGSSVVVFGVKGILIVNDQSNPWHGAAVDCSGFGAYAADGAPQMAGGTCMLIDADGDVQRLPWRTTNDQGGTWDVAEGTGKFANMRGSGTYVDVPVAQGRILNRWKFKQITP